MKTFKTAYLLAADETKLAEIIARESMKEVVWHNVLRKTDPNQGTFYINYLIIHQKVELLSILKPYDSLTQDVQNNTHQGINLIHMMAIH